MKLTGKIFAILSLIIITIYLCFAYFYSNHFVPNTNFGNIRISGMSNEKADEIITQHYDNKNLNITLSNETLISLPKKELISQDNIQQILKDSLNNQNKWAWPKYLFTKNNIDTHKLFHGSSLENKKNNLENWINQYNNNKKDAVNSSIVFQNNEFVITPSETGTKLDNEKAMSTILDAIMSNKEQVNLDNCLVQPTITQDNPKLKEDLTKLNQISNVKITYIFNDNKYEISKDTISAWLSTDDKGEIVVDKEKIKQFLTNLSKEYNIIGKTIDFQSTNSGTKKVKCETYGWSININSETNKLASEILKGENISRSPVIIGNAKINGPFIGKTYIEVDKTTQHMWVYKNGQVIIDTPIVTGKPETPTPNGVFYVWNKEKNAVLRGPGYESPVAYWMPIDWEGVGIHDSNWQSSYGGTRYRDGAGSHGCINTPPATMAKVFNEVPVGTPVIVYE